MTVEEAFAAARNAESAAEEYLVDEGWKAVEVGPETIAINRNGTNGNGLYTNGNMANGNGHTPVPVYDEGRHEDDDDEPQRSLFSWAEFMAEEPARPKARRGRPQPASMSMFEWAMTLEQDREKEPVGA